MEAKDSQAIAGNAADKVDRDSKVDSVSKVLNVSNDNHTQHPKHGWEVKPFEDCILKVKYPTKIPSSHYLKEGVYPIVSQEDELISGYWNNINDIFKVTSPVVIFGDHTRIIKYVDFDFVLGADGVKILQPIKDIKAKFLKLYLEYSKIPSLGYSRHYKLLKEISLPIPPMEEQERIVAELDCLSGVIEKKRQQLKEYDALAQSIFNDMFGDPISNEKGWEVKRLIDVVKMQRGFDLPVQERDNSGTIPIFGSNGIIGCHSSHKAEYGIITGRSGTLGEVYSCDKPFWPLNTTLFSVDTHGNNIIFLKYLMANFHLERFKAGAGVPTLNRNEFHNELIPNISLSLQQEFAEKVEAIEKQKELVKQSIAEAETLFNARMEYYFGDT